jgi:hypothetical protein
MFSPSSRGRLTEQAVSGAQVDDASAAKEPPHPPRHLPRLIKGWSPEPTAPGDEKL